MIRDEDRIVEYLGNHADGASITDISQDLDINRNLVAKNLRILLEAGRVELHQEGPAKIYSLSESVPLAKLLDYLFDRICIIDETGRIVQANASFTALLPTAESVVGRMLNDVPLPPRIIADAISYARDPPKKVIEKTYDKLDANGQVFELKYVHIVLPSYHNGIALLINDITGEMQAEEQLNLLTTVIEQQGIAVLLIELTRGEPFIAYANTAALELLCYTKEELIGLPPMILTPQNDPTTASRMRRAIHLGKPFDGKNAVVSPAGGSLELEWKLIPIEDAEGHATHYAAVLRDVSEKELEEQLLTTYERSIIALKALTDLALQKDAQTLFSLALRCAEAMQTGVLVRIHKNKSLTPAAYAHVDPQRLRLQEHLMSHLTLSQESKLYHRLMQSKNAITLYGDDIPELLADERIAHEALIKDLLPRNAAIHPLMFNGELLGTLEFWRDEQRPGIETYAELVASLRNLTTLIVNQLR